MSIFREKIIEVTEHNLTGMSQQIVQVNVGNRCNQLCYHCHLKASPDSSDLMSWDTMKEVLHIVDQINPDLVDITGGAPELHPLLPKFLKRLAESSSSIQVRTNLTVLQDEKRDDMIELYKSLKVRLVASLPCYLEEDVDHQRGKGVFKRSIEVLRELNGVGFGVDPELVLDLVFNPEGPFLPPNQSELEATYKEVLSEDHNVEFNNLLTITNMPIGRFQSWLEEEGKSSEYHDMLVDSFNPSTLDSLMCRYQICIGWDGLIYDCDFNFALKLPVITTPKRVEEFDADSHKQRKIVTGAHCFACTAGSGSSCSGALE